MVGNRASFLLFAASLLFTSCLLFKIILAKGLQKKCLGRVLIDLKGQVYLLFGIHFEKNLAVFLVFAHVLLDAYAISIIKCHTEGSTEVLFWYSPVSLDMLQTEKALSLSTE